MKRRFIHDYIVRLWLCNILFLLLGIALLYVSTFDLNVVVQGILDNIASLFIIAGVYNIISEHFLKKKYVEIILEKMNLPHKIVQTGLTDILLNINEINYNDFFGTAKSCIDIVHVYGKTWTNNNLEAIKIKMMKHKNISLNVLLLAPDSSVISSLSETYGGEVSKTIESMHYVASMWLDMFDEINKVCKKYKGGMHLYYHHGQPVYSLYRVDNKIICVLNKLSKGRTQQLPTFLCEKGEEGKDLFDIFYEEIRNLERTSDEVTRANIEMLFKKQSSFVDDVDYICK